MKQVKRHKALLRNKNTNKPYKKTLTVLAVIFMIYAVTLIFPLLWLVYNSLKNKIEFSVNPWAFPTEPIKSLANFGTIFSEFNLGSMFFNSLFLSIAMPLINLF